MHSGRSGNRWSVTFLLLLFLATCAAAEEGVLVLQVSDARHHPFASVRIGLAGEGGSPQSSDQNGRLRLKLAPNTKPFAWATLVLKGGPPGKDLVFISPYDDPARVRVPPFDNEQDNYNEVIVVNYGDKSMVESGSGRLAIEATSVAAQKPAPKSQNRPMFGEPRFLTVALRLGNESRNESDTTGDLQEAGMLAAAKRFGLSLADIQAAIADWGGSRLAWKTNMMTASIEAGGTNPFPFVQATGNDIVFGVGSWSLRGCSLQPLLLKFLERNRQRFAAIVGEDDSEWLSKTMSAPCEVSSNAALERMLEGPGVLRRSWLEKFRELGNEPLFQHVQSDEKTHSLEKAQSDASALGLLSDQALALCSYVTTQLGPTAISSQQESFARDIAAFKQQVGRDADEQERLLILANRTLKSPKDGTAPQFTPVFLANVVLLSQGDGIVLGRHYNLDEFGIGLTDSRTGAKIPVHDDKEVLRKLAAGWIPSRPDSSQKSTPASPASGQPNFRQFGNNACPAGPQPDAAGEQQLVALINRERTQRGILPVQVDARLTETARRHSAQMTQHQTVSHQFASEPPLERRFMDKELRSSFDGENIAMGDTVASVHRGLMNEPEHRDITLSPLFNSVGAGVLRCGSTLYVTEDYAGVSQNFSNDEAASAVQDALAAYATNHGIPTPVRKAQPELQQLACKMAQTHALDGATLAGLTGVRGVTAWFTANLKVLPTGPTEAVSQPLPSGYSLGTCFDSNAKGYWVVMITYE